MARSPTIRQLQAYRSVMSTGSVTAAAEILNLTQPALSKQINALEDILNLRLFDRRRGGPMVPTKAGLAFYKSIEGTLYGLDTIPEIAQSITERVSVRLRIAATPPLANSAPFLQALAAFRTKNNRIQLSLDLRPRVDLEDWVASRQVDVGLGLLPTTHPDLSEVVMAKTRLVAVVPVSNPLSNRGTLSLTDLQSATMILPNRQPLRDRIDAHFPNMAADIESSSSLTCCHLAAANQGIALCDPFSPTTLAQNAVKSIPVDPEVSLNFGAVIYKNHNADPLVGDLLELIAREFEPFCK